MQTIPAPSALDPASDADHAVTRVLAPAPVQVVAHDLAQAMTAAEAALSAGAPLMLRSPPATGRSLGVAGWQAIETAVKAALPSAELTFCLDCGDHAGDAHAALTFGAMYIALAQTTPGFARIADIASQTGARLVADPPILDLAFEYDPAQAVRRALTATTSR